MIGTRGFSVVQISFSKNLFNGKCIFFMFFKNLYNNCTWITEEICNVDKLYLLNDRAFKNCHILAWKYSFFAATWKNYKRICILKDGYLKIWSKYGKDAFCHSNFLTFMWTKIFNLLSKMNPEVFRLIERSS